MFSLNLLNRKKETNVKLIRVFLSQFTQRDSPRYRAGKRARVQKQRTVKKGGKRKK